MRPLIAGNWKMHGMAAQLGEIEAIGASEEIAEMHAHIRRCLVARLGTEGKDVGILYGGSVKPSNARDILALPEGGGAPVCRPG